MSSQSDEISVPRAHARAARVLFLVSEDWYFVSHRLPMARAARNAGFDVHVATRVDRYGGEIEREGFTLHPLPWRRGSFDPRHLVPLVRAVRRLYRDVRPDIAHHVAVEACAVGSLAAVGLPLACVNAITGLGTTFYGHSARERVARWPLLAALRCLLRRRQSTVIVQNPDDRAAIEGLGVRDERIVLIPGSGVDTAAMKPMPEPAGAVSVAFVGRMLESKGVRDLVAAHEILCRRGKKIRLLLAGLPDPANRDSIAAEEIASWAKREGIAPLGHVSDIRTVWEAAHIGALPSRVGEGMPLSMIEAAACGRPLIATDTSGCRQIVQDGVNGLLVPRGDADALANAIERLAADAELRQKFGRASRALVEREFSGERVGRDLVSLYGRILQVDGSVP